MITIGIGVGFGEWDKDILCLRNAFSLWRMSQVLPPSDTVLS